jgi:hypothetical protein
MSDVTEGKRRKRKPVRLDVMVPIRMARELRDELAREASFEGMPAATLMRKILIAHASSQFAARSRQCQGPA